MSIIARPPLPEEDLEAVLAHTRDLWAEARGKSIFITGGTGFFGMWLLESFAHINDSLGLGAGAVVLTRNRAAFTAKAPHLARRPDIELVDGDVRDFVFPPGRHDFIIHAAAETGAKPYEETPREMLDAIVGGMRRVLEFAGHAGTRKLLLTSSGAVYGPQPADVTRVPEDFAGAADHPVSGSPYGQGKRMAEDLCAAHGGLHGLEVKIARCFAFVGPHLPLDGHFAIGNFIGNALRGEPIEVGGDGTPYRSYLYAADLAAWLWAILFRGHPGRAYNVGSDADDSILNHARRVDEVRGGRGGVRVAREPVPGRPPSRYVPDIRRAQDELGLGVWTAESDGIRRTLAWLAPRGQG